MTMIWVKIKLHVIAFVEFRLVLLIVLFKLIQLHVYKIRYNTVVYVRNVKR